MIDHNLTEYLKWTVTPEVGAWLERPRRNWKATGSLVAAARVSLPASLTETTALLYVW